MPQDLNELRALLDRYERPLVRYAQSIVGEIESARDVVQETFIKWVETEGGAALSTDSDDAKARHTEAWLFTVCRNRAIDLQRKQRRIVPMNPQEQQRASEEPGPSSRLEMRDLAHSLVGFVQLLSENQQEVIRLKFQNDLSYKEISEITNLSVTNVGFLLHTGLKKLRSLMEESQPTAFELPLRQML